MSTTVSGTLTLEGTIQDLRVWSDLHAEMISKFEIYQNIMSGGSPEPEVSQSSGFQHGYSAEIGYLVQRRDTLDALIFCVERYGRTRMNSV